MHKIHSNCRFLCKKFSLSINHFVTNRLYCDEPVNRLKLNVLFFGTDKFSLQSLISLNESRKHSNSKIHRLDVVTSFKGHDNPIIKYASTSSLICLDWRKFDGKNSKDVKYDLGVVVSFGHLIPEIVINMFPLGMVNVHASLLPKWRGASPIIHSILNEDDVTGVSIMRIRPHKFDTGEVFAQRQVNVPESVLMPELHDTLSRQGAELLNDFIQRIPDSLNEAREQSDSNITYAPKVTDSMAIIDWSSMTSRHICNLYRALYSFKSLETQWQKRKLKIIELEIVDESSNEVASHEKRPGTIEYDKQFKCIRAYCIDGRCIRINRVKIEGKREMTAEEFSNGFMKNMDPSHRFFS